MYTAVTTILLVNAMYFEVKYKENFCKVSQTKYEFAKTLPKYYAALHQVC